MTSRLLRDIPLAELLPPSIAVDGQFIAAANACDPRLVDVLDAAGLVSLWSRLDEIDEPLLSELARQLHVDFWEDGITAETRRNLIRESIAWHRIKGTRGAVVRMLEYLGYACEIDEWWQYDGEPWFFRVLIDLADDQSLVLDDWGFFVTAVDAAKNVRSWLERLRVRRTSRGTVVTAAAVLTGETVTVWPWSASGLYGFTVPTWNAAWLQRGPPARSWPAVDWNGAAWNIAWRDQTERDAALRALPWYATSD